MFWFEYNFLYVLAADGRAEKAALGDHTPAGYRQRARFYAISDEGRLQLREEHRELHRLPRGEHRPRLRRDVCAARASSSSVTRRSMKC